MIATEFNANEVLATFSSREKTQLLRTLVAELLERTGSDWAVRLRDNAGQITAYLVPHGVKMQVPPIEDTPDYEAFLRDRAENPGRIYNVAEVEAMLDAEFGPMPPDPEWEMLLKSQS